ncbi:Calbindin-32 [Papilio machaon]|uniref:Calbindin-32 n=1 Tax=Papilio machaon TaxID=76193 RepID=A0A194QQ87_PAPMA|nr:Calbindin-32 [Papilio machaon]
MSFDSTSSKKLNFDRANNFMRQFRDPDSRELKKLSANQFMEVWSHYDRDVSKMTIYLSDVMAVETRSALVYVIKYCKNGIIKKKTHVDKRYEVKIVRQKCEIFFVKMKLVFLLTLLTVIASGFTTSASLDYNSSRANLYLGYIGAGDRLLARSTVQKRAVTNTIQSQDVAYYGNTTTRITAIQAVEIGVSQRARPRLISGGIGRRNATVRLETIRGGGFNYRVEFWGR